MTEWTRTPPTEPGWYWTRNQDGRDAWTTELDGNDRLWWTGDVTSPLEARRLGWWFWPVPLVPPPWREPGEEAT